MFSLLGCGVLKHSWLCWVLRHVCFLGCFGGLFTLGLPLGLKTLVYWFLGFRCVSGLWMISDLPVLRFLSC